MSALGICTAKVTKWRCMRGVMLKDPAVGFMQAQYCMLVTSLSTIFTCKTSLACQFQLMSSLTGEPAEEPDAGNVGLRCLPHFADDEGAACRVLIHSS